MRKGNKRAKQLKHQRKVLKEKQIIDVESYTIEEANKYISELIEQYAGFELGTDKRSMACGYEIREVIEWSHKNIYTNPKTRLVLSDNVGETVLLFGKASEIKENENGYRQLMISEPDIYNTPWLKGKTTLTTDELKRVINDPLRKPRTVDSHIWVDIDQIPYTGTPEGKYIPRTAFVFILGEVVEYKGKVSSNYHRKSYKYTIGNGNMVAAGAPLLKDSVRKEEGLMDLERLAYLDSNYIGGNYLLKWNYAKKRYDIDGNDAGEFYRYLNSFKVSNSGLESIAYFHACITLCHYYPKYIPLVLKGNPAHQGIEEHLKTFQGRYEPAKGLYRVYINQGKKFVSKI